MDHNTILITRALTTAQVDKLRQLWHEMYPGEKVTIVFGEMLTADDLQRAWVGPTEYKYQNSTAIPRYEG